MSRTTTTVGQSHRLDRVVVLRDDGDGTPSCEMESVHQGLPYGEKALDDALCSLCAVDPIAKSSFVRQIHRAEPMMTLAGATQAEVGRCLILSSSVLTVPRRSWDPTFATSTAGEGQRGEIVLPFLETGQRAGDD